MAQAADQRRIEDATVSMSAISPVDFGEAEARHLLWRAGFGGTPSQIRALAAMGPDDAVDLLLGHERALPAVRADERFDGSIVRRLTDRERNEVRRAQQAGDEDTLARFRLERQRQQRADREQLRELQAWWLGRMIEDAQPLHEKMTLFWHGHFATSYRKIENSYHLAMQNDLFRREATGNFGRLLFGIIRDPAMLAYLDNQRSSARAPNENLAREIMELFSLGRGHYSERDIREGARALTGYSFEGNEFVFLPNAHDDGRKTILGRSGDLDGDGFVEAILAQRRCAEFVVARLYAFFVSGLPDDLRTAPRNQRSVILSLTRTMLAERYEVRPVLRRLFLSEHFYDPALRGGQIKSPAAWTVGLCRELAAPARDTGGLVEAMGLMGQRLLLPPNVAGWPGGRAWINASTLLTRQNLPVFLLTGRRPGDGAGDVPDLYDAAPLLDDLGVARDASAREMATALAGHLYGVWADGARNSLIGERIDAAVEAAAGARGNERAVRIILALSAAPEHQLC
ncbi:MAG: DUF1800 family protein [Phycisphaerales bacterium]